MKSHQNLLIFNIFLLIGFGFGGWLKVESSSVATESLNQISEKKTVATITNAKNQLNLKENETIINFSLDEEASRLLGGNKFPNKNQAPNPNLLENTHNVLWITVDNLQSSSPKFLKIWLVIPQTSTNRLHIIPIYPGSLLLNTDERNIFPQDLSASFSLNNSQLSENFIKQLVAYDLIWTHFVITDVNFFQLAHQYLEKHSYQEITVSADSTNQQFENWWSILNQDDIHQMAIINKFCNALFQKQLEGVDNLEVLLAGFEGSYITDYSKAEIIQAMNLIQQDDFIGFCSFPTMNHAQP